jgi:UDP-glucose 4-epimerase
VTASAVSDSGHGQPFVAVTGASGFLGRHIAAALADAGYGVRRLSRRPASSDNIALPSPNAPEDAFREAVRGAPLVVHCAAMNNDARAEPALLEASNVVLPAKLARAAAAEGVRRFVFLSSTRAVAGAADSVVIDEMTEPRPRCAYGRSKRAAEVAVLATAGLTDGFTPIVLRLPPVYGRGMRGNLALLMRIARSGWPLPIAGIKGKRSLVSTNSVASAVKVLLDAEQLAGDIYVAADDRPASPADIVRAFRRGFGLEPKLYSVPDFILGLTAKSLGKGEMWQNLTGSQLCDSTALIAEGWTPAPDSFAALQALAAEIKASESQE